MEWSPLPPRVIGPADHFTKGVLNSIKHNFLPLEYYELFGQSEKDKKPEWSTKSAHIGTVEKISGALSEAGYEFYPWVLYYRGSPHLITPDSKGIGGKIENGFRKRYRGLKISKEELEERVRQEIAERPSLQSGNRKLTGATAVSLITRNQNPTRISFSMLELLSASLDVDLAMLVPKDFIDEERKKYRANGRINELFKSKRDELKPYDEELPVSIISESVFAGIRRRPSLRRLSLMIRRVPNYLSNIQYDYNRNGELSFSTLSDISRRLQKNLDIDIVPFRVTDSRGQDLFYAGNRSSLPSTFREQYVHFLKSLGLSRKAAIEEAKKRLSEENNYVADLNSTFNSAIYHNFDLQLSTARTLLAPFNAEIYFLLPKNFDLTK